MKIHFLIASNSMQDVLTEHLHIIKPFKNLRCLLGIFTFRRSLDMQSRARFIHVSDHSSEINEIDLMHYGTFSPRSNNIWNFRPAVISKRHRPDLDAEVEEEMAATVEGLCRAALPLVKRFYYSLYSPSKRRRKILKAHPLYNFLND